MSYVEELVDANPSALIDLYELDITNLPTFSYSADELESLRQEFDIIPANVLNMNTNWRVSSDVFYSPRVEDVSDWTISLTSGKSWNTVNPYIIEYQGVLNEYSYPLGTGKPMSVGSYYLDSSTGEAKLIADYSSSSYMVPTSSSFTDYGNFSPNDGTAAYTSTSITLTGDKWVSVYYPYTITSDTVIELEFSTTEYGSIHGVGLSEVRGTGGVVSYLENYGVYQPDTPSGYIIATDDVFAVSPNALCFSVDGTNMYVSRKDTGKITQYTSGVGFDISGMYYNPQTAKQLDISAKDSFAAGVTICGAGSYLYFSGFNTNKVYRYNMSTPYDLSTASYSQELIIGSPDIPDASNFYLQGSFMNEAGTKLYVVIMNNRATPRTYYNLIYQYNLGTPYNLTTAIYHGVSSFGGINIRSLQDPQDITFSPDGTQAFVVSYTEAIIRQYSLNTAWDIETTTEVGTWDTEDNYDEYNYYNTSAFEDKITSICFNTNGQYMYLLGNRTDSVHSYLVRNKFNIYSEQQVSESDRVIQIAGYDNFGVNYKIYDDEDTGYTKVIIPVGEMYTGDVEWLFFGVSTGTNADISDAVSIFRYIDVYESPGPVAIPLVDSTKSTFPASVLITALEDRILIFDITTADRRIWKTITSAELDQFSTPEIKHVDIASGMLYIGTDEGIFAYDFILDAISTVAISSNILDVKTTTTVEASTNTDRYNQPIPVLIYIDNGILKVKKYLDRGIETFVPANSEPTNFKQIEISASKELYAFTTAGKAYNYGYIPDIVDTHFLSLNIIDYFEYNDQDVTYNGIVTSELDNIKQGTKDGLYSRISYFYNTGYYTEETYALVAAFEYDNTLKYDGEQFVQNPNFTDGIKHYTVGDDWDYSSGSFIGINSNSKITQNVLVNTLDTYVVTVHVSSVQEGFLSIVLEPTHTAVSKDNVIDVQYIVDGNDTYWENKDLKYIEPGQEYIIEQRDITEQGVFSFLVPVRSYNTALHIVGDNFSGIVNSIKLSSINSTNLTNRISGHQTIQSYGSLSIDNISPESEMVQYSDGVILIETLDLEEIYIYYWEFDGVSWKFTQEEGYASNFYEGMYYIDCTMPKALVRLSSLKYTDDQLNVIRNTEIELFSSDSKVLIKLKEGESSASIDFVSFDDRTGYYYTQAEGTSYIQKFKNLVRYEEIDVSGSSSYYSNADSNNISLNDYSTYNVYFWGDETGAQSLGDLGIYRFYDGTNQRDNPIIWKEKAYIPWPIKVEGYELSGDREIPRPSLSASNIGFILSDLVHEHADLLGARVTRKRTFARYLDSVNFTDGNTKADPTIEFPDTVFFIHKKVSETFEMLSFELAAQWDLEGIKLPRRIVTYDTCRWKYKDGSCGYSGTKYFDIQGRPVQLQGDDVCGKTLDDCLKRFTEEVTDGEGNRYKTVVLVPFGGFPGVGL